MKIVTYESYRDEKRIMLVIKSFIRTGYKNFYMGECYLRLFILTVQFPTRVQIIKSIYNGVKGRIVYYC